MSWFSLIYVPIGWICNLQIQCFGLKGERPGSVQLARLWSQGTAAKPSPPIRKHHRGGLAKKAAPNCTSPVFLTGLNWLLYGCTRMRIWMYAYAYMYVRPLKKHWRFQTVWHGNKGKITPNYLLQSIFYRFGNKKWKMFFTFCGWEIHCIQQYKA